MFGGNKETICEIFRFILVFCIIYDCDPRMLREISFLQLTPQIEMENVKWSKSSNVHRIQNRIPVNLLGLAHKFWINYLFSNRYLLDKDQYLGMDCGLRYFPAKSRDLDLDWHWWTEEADICPHWSPPNCSCPTTSSSSIMMILTMMHRWLSHLRKTISMVFTAIWLDLNCTETPIHRKSGNKNSSELFPTTWLFCLFCFLPLDYSAHCSSLQRGADRTSKHQTRALPDKARQIQQRCSMWCWIAIHLLITFGSHYHEILNICICVCICICICVSPLSDLNVLQLSSWWQGCQVGTRYNPQYTIQYNLNQIQSQRRNGSPPHNTIMA